MKPVRTFRLHSLIVVLLAAMSTQAVAQTPYLAAGAGVAIPDDSDLNGAGANRKAALDLGFAGLVAGGYELGDRLRAELELGYRKNDANKIAGTSASGDVRTLSGMANLLYDIDVGTAIQPFIGLGLGIANVDAHGLSPVGATSVNDNDTGFAYQALAGVEYPLNDRLRLDLSYRYFAVPDATFSAANGASIGSDYTAHTIMLGLRFRFTPRRPAPAPVARPAPTPPPVAQRAPEPAPTPAPPPPPRTYIVFFDWDSAELTPEARRIIATAARNAGLLGLTRVLAVGYTDLSGPASYNLGLSRRRAVAVKDEFVRRGIRPDEITVVGRGEANPLVPTDDGVREPRNRRVEIELQ